MLDFYLELHVAFLPSRPLSSITKDKNEKKHASKNFGENTKQKPTRWSLISNYLKIGSLGETKQQPNCVNELWPRLLKDHKNLKLDLEVWFLLGPSTIHSCEEGLVKCKGAYSAYGCFLFPFPWANQAQW